MNVWTNQTYRTSVLLAMIITYAVISGGCTIADTQEPAAAAVVPTPTFSGLYETWPGMDPTRRAVADQYNQTIEAALATPQGQVPTPISQLQTTISDPLLSPGIHPDCIDGTATSSAIIGTTQNCWTGFVSDTYIFVRAGAAISDVQQGRILVAVFAEDQSGIVEHFFYDTPTMHGAVAVQSYVEPQLTVQASDGTAFVFNLATRTWNTSEHTAVPVFATPDTLPVPTPQATPPPNPANDSEHILFASWRTPRENIYLLQGFDTDPRHLIDSPAREMSPVWSPDRRSVAFISDRYGGPEILIFNMVTEDIQRLTATQWFKYNLAWSPDGTRIAFDSGINLYSIDQEGNLINVTQNPRDGNIQDNDASWSPDGTRIAFTSTRDGNKEIYVMQADGTNPMRLTTHPEVDHHPAWAPS
ncbi:MAG: hypothetical protein HC876_22595 [Chloroflexaceae bacterium]|nr:hypothetical protein [bacterium]NJO08080.1 hypothetical protein [Chloroflexaceae bacterium]